MRPLRILPCVYQSIRAQRLHHPAFAKIPVSLLPLASPVWNSLVSFTLKWQSEKADWSCTLQQNPWIRDWPPLCAQGTAGLRAASLPAEFAGAPCRIASSLAAARPLTSPPRVRSHCWSALPRASSSTEEAELDEEAELEEEFESELAAWSAARAEGSPGF